MTDEDKKWLLDDVIGTMASKALRTLCLAYRDLSNDLIPNDWEGHEGSVVDHLTCVGVVGIQDPVRPEVPDCIRSCQEAGVTVRMVTGDNHATAKAIAIQCGIIGETSRSRYEVMTGTEFNEAVRDANGKVSITWNIILLIIVVVIEGILYGGKLCGEMKFGKFLYVVHSIQLSFE